MAQRHDTDPEQSLAPVLLSPRRQLVVDGQSVTFEWEPVPHGTAHELEVAADPHFDEVVFEVVVEGRRSLTVLDTFGTAGRTYYWRILVQDPRGHLHGEDVVQSFVAGTADEAAAYAGQSTGEDETFGPVGELFRGAATEVTAEVTQSDEYFRREVELGVAHEGIAAGQILAITLGIVLALVLIVVTLIQYTQITAQEIRYSAVGISGYPELHERETAALQALGEYGVLDAEQGVYRIPIERAMELMANEAYQAQGRSYSPELPLQPRN